MKWTAIWSRHALQMLCKEFAAADAWWGCCKQYSKKFKTGSENKTPIFSYRPPDHWPSLLSIMTSVIWHDCHQLTTYLCIQKPHILYMEDTVARLPMWHLFNTYLILFNTGLNCFSFVTGTKLFNKFNKFQEMQHTKKLYAQKTISKETVTFLTSYFSDHASWIDYKLITNLMHWLLFIHKILYSSTCFEP